VSKTAKVVDAVIYLKDSFTVTMDNATKSSKLMAKQIKETGKSIETTGKTLSGMGSTLTKGLTLPIVAAGVGLLKIAQDFETAKNSIRTSTGATGATLDALDRTMQSVYSNTVSSLSDSSAAVAGVYQKLGLTGKSLETVSTQMANLSRITKTDLSTNLALASQAFHAMNLSSSQYSGALDQVYKVSQSTGVGIDDMLANVQKYAPALKDMGMNFNDVTTLIGSFTKSGVNVQQVMTGLRIGIATMAKGGIKDASQAVKVLFSEIQKAPDTMTATAEAVKVFGSRAGPALAVAIREGKLSYTDLLKTISGSKDTINKAADATLTPMQRLIKIGHQLQVALEPVAASLVTALEKFEPTIIKMADGVKKFADWLSKLSPQQKEMAMKLLLIAAAAGPVLKVVGPLVTGAGKMVTAISGVRKGIDGLQGVARGAKMFENLFGMSPQVLLVIAVIAAIAFLAYVIIKNWKPITGFFIGIWNGIRSVFGAVGKWFTDIFNGAVKGIQIVWGGIVNFFTGAVNAIEKAWSGVGAFFKGLWSGVTSIFKGVINFYITGIDTILGGLNGVIGTVGKVIGLKVAIPLIPHFASGTDYFQGGTALVGEKGPELINMPKGSQVINNNNTNKALNSRSISIAKLADTIVVREDADIDKIAIAIVKRIKIAELNLA
jgi:TP901 family phage tail tape measure protein